MNSRIWRFVACLGGAVTVAATALPLPSGAKAQSTDTASLVGVVTDSLQAAVPGVTLTARQVNTGLTRTTVSNDRGFYRLLALPPGEYELTAELSGFSVAKRTGVKLTVGAEAAIDITLQPGGMAEQVTVRADVPIVETTTSQTGGTLQRDQLDLLPTISRDFRSFLILMTGYDQYERRSCVPRGARPLQPLADRRRGQQLRLGRHAEHHAPARLYRRGPGADGKLQGRVGRVAGGVVNAITRSGSNTYHGGAFMYFRNEDMRARSPFEDPSVPKAPFQRLYNGGPSAGRFTVTRPISSARSNGTIRTRTPMPPTTCRHRPHPSRQRRCSSSRKTTSARRSSARADGSSSSAHLRSSPTRRRRGWITASTPTTC